MECVAGVILSGIREEGILLHIFQTIFLMMNSFQTYENGEKVFKFNINDEYYIRVVIDEFNRRIKYLRKYENPFSDKRDKIEAMKLFIPEDLSKHCILELTVQYNLGIKDSFYGTTIQQLQIARVLANKLAEKMGIYEA